MTRYQQQHGICDRPGRLSYSGDDSAFFFECDWESPGKPCGFGKDLGWFVTAGDVAAAEIEHHRQRHG